MITKNDQYNPFYPNILILLPKNIDDNNIPIEFHSNIANEIFSYKNNIIDSSIIKVTNKDKNSYKTRLWDIKNYLLSNKSDKSTSSKIPKHITNIKKK